MPDYLSHALFAKQLLAQGGFAHYDDCAAYPHLFRYGSQGPDLFYYLAYVCPGKGFSEKGDVFHGLRQSDVRQCLLRCERENQCAQGEAQRRAYLCGVAAHLCLDGAAHPYIERRSAEIAAVEPDVSESCAHVRLESCFEARQLFEQTGLQPSGYDARGDLPQSDEERQTVALCWQALAEESGLAAFTSAELGAVCGGMRRLPLLFSIVFDRHGIVKGALDLVRRCRRRDFALRWHIKRPYDGNSAPLREEDAAAIEQRYQAALRAFPAAMGPAGARQSERKDY